MMRPGSNAASRRADPANGMRSSSSTSALQTAAAASLTQPPSWGS
jgi:hypothetical protein